MISEKLNNFQNLTLQNFIGKNFSKGDFIDENLLKSIVNISALSGLEICVIIARNGSVIDIVVGNKNSIEVKIDNNSKYLSGYRLIHTHPNASKDLSDLDISLLKNNKLDCICAISIINKVANDAQIAFYNGKKVNTINVDNANYLNKYGLIEKIAENIEEYKQNFNTLISLEKKNERAILVFVNLTQNDITEDIEELKNLCKTANIDVLGVIVQNKNVPDSKYFIGAGKMEDLKSACQNECANLIIFDNELSGSKQSNISNATGIKVIDKSMLILDIFASRANSNEGKIQVELAQLKYSLPRLSAYLQSSGRFGGGVGMRGPGETAVELNKRIVEKNIIKKTKELDNLKKQRDINRKSRIQNKIPVIAIVGYTNSGKSTLLNYLAKDNIYAKDELFATLNTTTRNVYINDKTKVLVTDTVGFIKNLPHEFIEAFSSTLEECVYADLLLNVVDISNKNYEKQNEVTLSVLKKLGCKSPIINVYNKIDNLKKEPNVLDINSICVSAITGYGIEKLKKMILNKISSK